MKQRLNSKHQQNWFREGEKEKERERGFNHCTIGNDIINSAWPSQHSKQMRQIGTRKNA